MTRRLNRYVLVGSRSWGPDDEVPDDVAAKISPDFWSEVDEKAPAESAWAPPSMDVSVDLLPEVDFERLLAAARSVFDGELDFDEALPAVVRAVVAELGIDLASEPAPGDPLGGEGDPQFPGAIDQGAPDPGSEPADPADAPAPLKPADIEVPNRGGKGSSKAHWLEYARSQNVKVTDDMERHDVIAACREASVPVD